MTERRINAGILGTGHYLPPRILTGLVAARPAAVAVAAVAAAAQDDLDAAARAQVKAGGLVHAHPGTTEVLDGLVRSAPHCCGTAFIGTV